MGRGAGRWLADRLEDFQLSLRDLGDALRGRRHPLVPPRRLLYDGPRDPEVFLENGREFLRHYVDLCGLRPEEHVLDVGSGMGRKTVPLTGYLSAEARYLGLDVHPRGVAWCRRQISSRFPRFTFAHVDVYNQRYNPRGRRTDETFTFPCEDASFDFVVLASVFTHMRPAGVARYLAEVARVLRPAGGRCLISFFLLDDASRAGIAAGGSPFHFAHDHGRWAVEDPDLPEDAVAYDTDYVRELYAAAGLEISKVFPGSWCGGRSGESFQDLLLARPAAG